MIEEIKTLTQRLSLSPAMLQFVRIVYGQLFHLSAVMPGINRTLNTGSCEFSILWLVASGISVVILKWWNTPLQYGMGAFYHLSQNKAADSSVSELARITRLLSEVALMEAVPLPRHSFCIDIKEIHFIKTGPCWRLIAVLRERFWKIGLIQFWAMCATMRVSVSSVVPLVFQQCHNQLSHVNYCFLFFFMLSLTRECNDLLIYFAVICSSTHNAPWWVRVNLDIEYK